MNKNLNSDFDITIQKVIEYMNKNLCNSLTLDQLADYAGISKYGFARKFKKKVGYSPIDYYNRLRVQKACEMLKSTNMSIKEISYSLSYNNQYYFSTVFKNIVGVSPNKYRKN